MRTKIKNEEKASGISPTRSEVEEALEYLIEKEDASGKIHKSNLNRKDDVAEREKAEEVRNIVYCIVSYVRPIKLLRYFYARDKLF